MRRNSNINGYFLSAKIDLGCSFWWMSFQHHDCRVLFIMTWSMAFHQSWSIFMVKIIFPVALCVYFYIWWCQMSIRRENQAYKSKLNDETIGTSLIKTIAFIFPVRFEQATCSSSWMTFILSICIDPLKMKWKEIENGPDYQPLMWLHTRWSWSSKGQGGSHPSAQQRKRSSCQGSSSFSHWRVMTALFQIRDWSIGRICGQQSNFNTRLCTDRWGLLLIKGQFTFGAMGMKLQQLPLFI